MKKLIFAAAILVLCSCKKDPGIQGKNPNNHMEATVTFKSGHVVTINETGDNVTFSHGGYGGGYGVSAINSRSQQVWVGYGGYSGPNGSGNYDTDYGSNIDSAYSSLITPGDTLFFTVNNGNYKEGHFHYTCTYNTINPDTVILAGSFKGEFPE